MATESEKVQCVYWYAESEKSAVTFQRNYRRVYRKTSQSVNSIKNWSEKLLKTGSVQYQLMLTDDLNVLYPNTASLQVNLKNLRIYP
jgi:hypothetical protein